MSILSPERTVTRMRPVQIAESVVTALSDHVYRAARERALQDAIERCAQHPRSVHRRETSLFTSNVSAPTRHLSVRQLRHEH